MPKTLIYQMYPDAWGNFKKMTQHLDRLQRLHVDYVWLSPCFESPWNDGGYDVSDYVKINPRFGDMADFDNFVTEAKKRDINVLLDLVLNHTSTEHEWFKKAIHGDPQYKDYYIWVDENLGWGNHFGDHSAFEWNDEAQQYYLHLFHKTQADLNWDNPMVLREFQSIIDFWTKEHGVAGFRLDVAQFLSKKLRSTVLPKCFGIACGFLNYYQKPKTIDVLNQLFRERKLFVFSESGFVTKKHFRQLTGMDAPLGRALNTLTYGNGLAVESFMFFKILTRYWSKEPNFIACVESHDVPRSPSRYKKDGEEILETLFSSGANTVCIYQGQELGSENPDLPHDISGYKDAMTIIKYKRLAARGVSPEDALKKLATSSRDNARQPLSLAEYCRQEQNRFSYLAKTRQFIEEWKNTP